MMKLKKGAGLVLTLFALCGCNNHNGNVRVSNDGNSTNEGSDKEEVPGNPEVAYKNMVKLANNGFIANKHLQGINEYVKDECVTELCSIEFDSNGVTYTALGDSLDGNYYLVKVSMLKSYQDEDEFIYKMSNLNVENPVWFNNALVETYDLVFEESLSDKFEEKLPNTCPKCDMENVFCHLSYKVNDDYYFAFTYKGTDSKIYSINEMKYNESIDSFEVNSEYGVSRSANTKMYDLFEQFIA